MRHDAIPCNRLLLRCCATNEHDEVTQAALRQKCIGNFSEYVIQNCVDLNDAASFGEYVIQNQGLFHRIGAYCDYSAL